MKTFLRSTLSVMLVLVCLLSFTACGKDDTAAPTNAPGEEVSKTGVWADATYLKDTTLGEGDTTLTVEVTAQDQKVTFTIHTDETTVGDALLAHKLIDGDDSEYGLYIKVVNGMTADYDVDQSYWAFYIDGEYAMSGVDTTDITEGAVYQLAYTK